MPRILPPRLDDRSYQDLRDELVRRIPVHAPEWTDINPSDPGIALIELFAHLGETLLQRLNRVPEAAHLEFLRLLGIQLRAAQPSRAQVRFDLARGQLARQVLAFGPATPRALVAAGRTVFQALGEVTVLPAEALPMIKRRSADGIPTDAVNLPALLATLGLATSEDLQGYDSFRLPEPKLGQVPPATLLEEAADKRLWLGLAAPEAVLRTTTLEAVRAELAGQVLTIGIRVDDELRATDGGQHCPDVGSEIVPPRVVWQIATGRFRTGAPATIDNAIFTRLSVVEDTTVGLTRSGLVRVQLPLDPLQFGTWRFDDQPATLALPVAGGAVPALQREYRGVGELPPALDDAMLEARVITWLRCFRSDGMQPALRWVDINVVDVEQAVTADPEFLGYANGRPGQQVLLAQPPVVVDSVLLEVLEPSGWQRYEQVADLAYAGPDDRHYALDAVTGRVSFGDGLHGRVPQPGEAIRVLSYRSGGGVAGNVAAGAIQRVQRYPEGDLGLRVINPLPAEGGRDGETVAEARSRIPQLMRHQDRAVAVEDFHDLALETPGAPIGRVEVLARFLPQGHVEEVPGVITLVVLPAYDPLHPEEPVPDRAMLRRVCEHLEPRRLATTELHIIPPTYVPLWVSVAIAVREGYGIATVRRWVELAVRQALAPLPPYGPAGRGWPFGRDVRVADLEAAVLQVEGVQLVNEVLVLGAAPDAGNPASDHVAIARWELPVLRDLRVVDGDEAEAIDRGADLARPPGAAAPLPVPVEKDEC